jgi:hypothetical protein
MSLKFSGLIWTYLPTVGKAPVCGKFIPKFLMPRSFCPVA